MGHYGPGSSDMLLSRDFPSGPSLAEDPGVVCVSSLVTLRQHFMTHLFKIDSRQPEKVKMKF